MIEITEQVWNDFVEVQNSGQCNMMSWRDVQYAVDSLDCYDLVDFIASDETRRKDEYRYILDNYEELEKRFND